MAQNSVFSCLSSHEAEWWDDVPPSDPTPYPPDPRCSRPGQDRGRGTCQVRVPAGRRAVPTVPEWTGDVLLRSVPRHGLSNRGPQSPRVETGKEKEDFIWLCLTCMFEWLRSIYDFTVKRGSDLKILILYLGLKIHFKISCTPCLYLL